MGGGKKKKVLENTKWPNGKFVFSCSLWLRGRRSWRRRITIKPWKLRRMAANGDLRGILRFGESSGFCLDFPWDAQRCVIKL